MFLFFINMALHILMQHGVTAFTVSQPEEAMRVLEQKAATLDVSFL